MNKKGFEFSFTWLFAIIVGAVVIFIAIYAAVRFVDFEQTDINAQAGEQLGILLNPIETSLEDGKYSVITFPDETRIRNRCLEQGTFGQQAISTSIRSDIGEEWVDSSVDNFFYNKYLFSKSTEQGEKLHIISKSFEMPYKIASLIFATSEDYCFIDPSSEIEDELEGLAPGNIEVVNEKSQCKRGSITVCFNQRNCDIEVDTNSKSVFKDGQTVYYEGSLIYGAIFADSGIYECQVNRLMKRSAELASLYAQKSDFLSSKGCSSNLGNELRDFASITVIGPEENSLKLKNIYSTSENLRRKNELLSCELF